ncbi:alkanesulfonate monooxygenase SsuD/methylene tetrahydromethanopterin reductase-like flavin-dependent oxidoreductase (luciferase family) [Catenuloplanes nepalensis]|uniref:Alkanesulfonate monooxygenase SsuD/methylene tetrahydromethanopterin reductase-like flavin-dependent oxidoreductase (Luciferase family) n=1 Tax=Catenuloplanes nepalensis TaxID=587533 RepID=A0ABT9MRS4_9ACTN|nr:LLM class flavin-dependent oxidoreductase [Catenuloplanes nepalensis]MDP9794083.1 alkanesulfonate monooxygenase SsuD/methylene tetrahydromethanopterin reductase-like flavin-dependent oxidoreductase (luciferase family) [Catenuloplanes nepalensis]
MRIGVILPSVEVQRRDDLDLATAARHAEDAGLDSVWHGDHLATGTPTVECTIALAVAATATCRISIGASVFVPAIRPLAWAAKAIASLQLISGDRLLLGIGSGGGPAQWAAAGIPFPDRGPRTDTALRLLPALLTGDPVTLPGGDPVTPPAGGPAMPRACGPAMPPAGDPAMPRACGPAMPRAGDAGTAPGVAEVTLAPGVAVPPLWVGNASPVAIDRAARLGDGWFPSLITPAALAAGRERLVAAASASGRPEPAITIGAVAALGGAPGTPTRDDLATRIAAAYRHIARDAAAIPLTGTPAEAAERIAEYAANGATHLVAGVSGPDWRAQTDLLAEVRRQL